MRGATADQRRERGGNGRQLRGVEQHPDAQHENDRRRNVFEASNPGTDERLHQIARTRDQHAEERGERERDRRVDAQSLIDEDGENRGDQRDRVHAAPFAHLRAREREGCVIACRPRPYDGVHDNDDGFDRSEHVDVRPERALLDAENLAVEFPLREIEDIAEAERHQEQRRRGRTRHADRHHHR